MLGDAVDNGDSSDTDSDKDQNQRDLRTTSRHRRYTHVIEEANQRSGTGSSTPVATGEDLGRQFRSINFQEMDNGRGLNPQSVSVSVIFSIYELVGSIDSLHKKQGRKQLKIPTA